MAELVDAGDLKSFAERLAGSSPALGIESLVRPKNGLHDREPLPTVGLREWVVKAYATHIYKLKWLPENGNPKELQKITQ